MEKYLIDINTVITGLPAEDRVPPDKPQGLNYVIYKVNIRNQSYIRSEIRNYCRNQILNNIKPGTY